MGEISHHPDKQSRNAEDQDLCSCPRSEKERTSEFGEALHSAGAVPIPKSMMGYARPEPRQLPKDLKLHSREEAENDGNGMALRRCIGFGSMTSTSQSSIMHPKDYQEMIVRRWAHLANQMKMNREKKTYQMEAHLVTQRVSSHA